MENVSKHFAEELRGSRPRLEKLRPAAPAYRQLKDMLQPVAGGKEETLRNTGIDILGGVPWGTHFCLFYHTKQDLIDILVPYFKAGLENNEFCMWVTSEPLNAQDAKQALKRTVRNLDAYINKGQIQFLDYSDWYTRTGAFEADSALQGWVEKHDQAIKNGFDGLRLTGNTFWLEKKDWAKFVDYEAVVNSVIGKYKMLGVCTYSLDKCGASEILDVEHNHQFALIKWRGDWKILESSSKNQLEARLAEQTAIAQALERSKKDWVKTFNAMSDWVAFIDLKGRILRTNRAGENFTGKPIAEIIGQSCCKLVHGSEKHIPGCPLRIMLHTRQRATVELNVPNTNRWLMVTTDPVIDEKGNLIGAVHVTRDITERKKDEKALRDSEQRYKYLFEQSPLGIGLATPDGKVVRVNKTMEVITEYSEQELKRINLADTFENPEDWKRLLETIDRYSCAVDFPTRLKRKDGTVFDALLNVSRVHLAGQDLLQTICMDVSEQKEAEQALRESEARLSVVFGKVPAVLILVDSDRRVHLVNDAAARFAKRTADEMKGLRGGDALRCLRSLDDPKGCGYGPFCDICVVRNTVLETFKTGRGFSQREAQLPFDIDGKTVELSLLLSTATLKVSGRQMVLVCLEDITERKKAEEALRESEERYRTLFETAGDAILMVKVSADQGARFVDCNSRALDMFGCSREELIGKGPEDFSPPTQPDGIPSHAKVLEIAKATAQGKPQFFEWAHRRLDGTSFLVEVTLNYVGMHDETYMQAHVRDITERKKAEGTLRIHSEIMTNMSEGVYLIRVRDGVILLTNPKFDQLFGYRPGELIGKHVSIVNAPTAKSPEEMAEEIMRVLNEKGSWRGEICNIKKDGTPFWCYASVSIFDHPEHGKVWISTHTDITERRKAAEQIENLAKFPAENPYPVLRLARDGTILYANQASIAPLRDNKSGLGQPAPQQWRQLVEQVLSSGSVERREAEHEGRVFAFRAVPVIDAGYVNFYGVDITERKKAERKLFDHQAKLKSLASQLTLTEERQRRQIAAGLHDQVSQSLSFSKMKLEALRKSETSAQAKQALSEVCDQLGQAIDDTKSLTFDLSSPVLYELGFEAAVSDWLTEQVQEKHGIKTEFEDDGQPKPLDDDVRVLLFRDVRELLINVVKHAHANKVKVSIRKAGTQIQVCVEDDGAGFDPVETTSMAARRAEFGLFSIRERLEELAGNLEIDSVPGRGCKVTMTAPLKKTKK